MPAHPPQWTDFLLCSHCTKKFSTQPDCLPITLLCGHSICKGCIGHVQSEGCRFDQNTKTPNLSQLPPNAALLQIVIHQGENLTPLDGYGQPTFDFGHHYDACVHILENLAMYLRDVKNGILPQKSDLTKPMLRKLVSLVQCQLVLEPGRLRALSACRALAERVSTELILAHQNPATLSGNLWTAVRARGCQFLGPAMQEEALKLIHLALEDGSELSRKVLVMFVVQKLQQQFPQASKTCIGHVVQLLYRASCFVVKKRDQDSSLMKLKESYRTFSALRREHDTQIVQIAREAGLRIAPDQWSALLYGDQGQKSHMQSIIDRLQSGESLKRCIQDLENALDKSSDSEKLQAVIPHFEILSEISEDCTAERESPKHDWDFLIQCLQSIKVIIEELISFMKNHSLNTWREEEVLAQSAKFKTSFCRNMKSKGRCPRGTSCTFAHTDEELRLHRNKRKKANLGTAGSRDKTQRSPAHPEEAIDSDTNVDSPQLEHIDSKAAAPSPINPVLGQAEQNPCYYTPHTYTPPPMVPVNPIPPQYNHPSVPPTPFGIPPQPPPMPSYHYSNYDSYRQTHLPFHPPQNNSPYIHPVPQQDQGTGAHCNNPDLSQKPFVVADPNLSQFTVTVSFQPNPNQRGNHYQSANEPARQVNKSSLVYPPDKVGHPQRENIMQEIRFGHSHHDMFRNTPGDANVDHFRNPSLPSAQAQVGHMAGYYPMLPQHNSPQFVAQAGHVVPANPIMYHQVKSPMYRFPVVTPDPMNHHPNVPSPNPTPSHVYDPNTNTIIQQNHPVGQNARNSRMQQALPQSLQPAKQRFIPVMPVPFPGYQAQVVDQGPWPNEQGVRDAGVSERMDKYAIPKSIDDASVRELEHRKGQILNEMIRKQRKEVPSMTSEQHYDILRSVSEYLPTNDSSSGLVNVMAELDTETKQVTMRDEDHINPSPAHDERILDDVKMHEIVLERHHILKSTANVSHASGDSEPHLHYSSGSPGDEDEIIPFSDRPTVSKYGPIARSRTGTGNSRSDHANSSPNSQFLCASLGYDVSSENVEPIEAYSSLESLHATSCLPYSALHSHESLDAMSAKVSYELPVTSVFDQNSASLSQATSNTRLVHREQAALQQNRALSDTEDLELAMELQQIEIGIRQKKQKRAAAVKLTGD